MRSGIVPVPLMRLFYQALGARLGSNSYTAGILYDPLFIAIGDNTLIGEGALLVPHAVEGEALSHQPIRLGNRVTIGARAIVFGGVEVGDGAIVAAGSIVGKGERIGPGEVWGGIPSRRLR
jgi:acetyltransferase-like isoleucine patch superfamily enzyme